MKNIKISHVPTKYNVDEFLEHHENALVELFYKQKTEILPFGNLLLNDGSSLILLFTEDKEMSMHQTKLLAFMTGAIAYIGIHEAFVKETKVDKIDDESINKVIKDLGPISSLPDCQEVLLMIVEYKKSGKMKSDMVVWTIENTPSGRKLTNRRNGPFDKLSGRMTGIIIP